VPPSPKFHARETIVPSGSVDESVKLAVSPLVVTLKFAVGGVFAPPPETAASVACALMMPAPHPPDHEPGSGRAFAVM
jgi:hypothetical protein